MVIYRDFRTGIFVRQLISVQLILVQQISVQRISTQRIGISWYKKFWNWRQTLATLLIEKKTILLGWEGGDVEFAVDAKTTVHKP